MDRILSQIILILTLAHYFFKFCFSIGLQNTHAPLKTFTDLESVCIYHLPVTAIHPARHILIDLTVRN
jgi:hypothetical protein